MKKIFLLVASVLIVCAPVLKAQELQQPIKLDVEGLKKKISKSDAAIADPKKGAKASTWIDRGFLFHEVALAPAAGVFKGQEEAALKEKYGAPVKPNYPTKVEQKSYRTLEYKTFKAYLEKVGENFKVVCWMPSMSIDPKAIEKSLEAYMKAYALDDGKVNTEKVNLGQKAVVDYYRMVGQNEYLMHNYVNAADAFTKAYDAGIMPPMNVVDTTSIYNAGHIYTATNEYEKAIECLNKAKDLGYYANGDTYYFLFYCYNGLKDKEKAKESLLEGVAKFPESDKIIDGLMNLYASGAGDPKEIVPIIQAAIEKDPKDANLYAGLGLIYEKLGESDKSLESIQKARELKPDDFGINFNYGLLLIKKGDKMNSELNARNAVGDDYRNGLAAIKAVYAQAVAPLEKALELDPSRSATIELLKNICFRLRNEPGFQEKYDKYNKMFEELPKMPPAK